MKRKTRHSILIVFKGEDKSAAKAAVDAASAELKNIASDSSGYISNKITIFAKFFEHICGGVLP